MAKLLHTYVLVYSRVVYALRLVKMQWSTPVGVRVRLKGLLEIESMGFSPSFI